MQTNLRFFLAAFMILMAVCAFQPAPLAHAQGEGTVTGGGGITNPLDGGPDQTITSVLTSVINWMLGLVAFLALIALIIGGGRMIINFGNEEQVKKAKTTILWAVIGLAVVILSYAIINIVVSDILGGGGAGGNVEDASPSDRRGGPSGIF